MLNSEVHIFCSISHLLNYFHFFTSLGSSNVLHGRWIRPYERRQQQYILPWPLCQSNVIIYFSNQLSLSPSIHPFFYLCRSIISAGTKKNNPLTCTVSSASWPNSASNYSSCWIISTWNHWRCLNEWDHFHSVHHADVIYFCSFGMHCRECECLGLEDFPTAGQLQWHGHQPGKPDWSETSRFVAFSMVKF